MDLKPELVAKAHELFKSKRLSAQSRVSEAMGLLENASAFMDFDDDVIEAYAREGLKGLPTPAPLPQRHSSGGQRQGGYQGGAGHGGQNHNTAGRAEPTPRSTPYRFVTLPDTVVPPEAQVAINARAEGRLCATLRYELTAETPLLIGGAETQDDEVLPLQIGGAYALPGASIRGMLRAAVEIVAHGRLGSANLHHRFGLRDFEHAAYGEGNYPVGKVAEVKAGWLTATFADDRITSMEIAPCEWWKVRVSNWPLCGNRLDWVTKKLKAKYAAMDMESGDTFNFSKTRKFSNPFKDTSTSAGGFHDGKLSRDPDIGDWEGVPVFGGVTPGKKDHEDPKKRPNKEFEYVFEPQGSGERFAVPPEVIALFTRLYSKPSKNKPEPDGSFAELLPTLKAGKRIPVFYVNGPAPGGAADAAKFFFGLTRLFKVPHARSVGEVLAGHPAAPLKHIVGKRDVKWSDSEDGRDRITSYPADFVENLFGYVVEPKDIGIDSPSVSPQAIARKGRVACGFAWLKAGHRAETSTAIKLVQSAPRASFAPFYLASRKPGHKGYEPDYSAANPPRLAGRKRYMPREQAGNAPRAWEQKIIAQGQHQRELIKIESKGKDWSAKVYSQLRFLVPPQGQPPLAFKGEIRLHNVSPAELGAVLFALTHGTGGAEGPYRHMLGRAKAFGAGQMRLSALALDVKPNVGGEEKGAKADGYLKAFCAYMREQPELKTFPDVPAVRQFLFACDPREGAKLEGAGGLTLIGLSQFNPIRKATKPEKGTQKQPPRAPWAPDATDGRLAGAGTSREAPVFWK